MAEFLTSVTADDIPAPVLDRVREDVIDIAGCILWGYESSYGRAIVEHVADSGDSKDVLIWGSGVRGSPGSAALAMGTLGHAFDFDDYHAEAKLHPATVVLPAVFALGEYLESSGADVLRASVLGFESMIRLSLGSGPVPTMLNGFHLTGICGSVGAAAGAAVLLGLGEEQTAHALGLAATQAAGLMGFLHDGSETKRLHAGRAAQSGILAAQLAGRGFTGPARVFELEHGGFCSAFSTQPRPEKIVEGLGVRWTAGEVSFKRWSCCGSVHSTLDLVELAVVELGVSPTDIDEIEVGQSPAVIAQCGWDYVPSDALHAQMSLKYCVAALLAEGTVAPAQFRPELLDAPDILALARRVRVRPDPEIALCYPAKFASRILVRALGREAEFRADHPKGAPDNPLSPAEMEDKFRALSARRLSSSQQSEVVRQANRIETIDGVSGFTRLLASSADREAQHKPAALTSEAAYINYAT